MIRPIRIEGEVAFITLTKGYEAVIDAVDVPLVEGANWTAAVQLRRNGEVRSVYAFRTNTAGAKRQTIYLHRVISSGSDNLDVDHIDGNGLNNRQINLRSATKSQNQANQRKSIANKSGIKGVCWHKATGKWRAQIKVGGKKRIVGCYLDKDAAATAYVEASTRLHGEFGRAE